MTDEALWDALVAQADRLAPKLRQAFLKALSAARGRLSEAELARYLDRGEIEALVARLVPEDAFAGLIPALRNAALVTAKAYATEVGLVQLDALNPWAERALAQHGATLVQQVTDTVRQGIRDYVAEALRLGENPRSVITDLAGYVRPAGLRDGGIIGLTARQSRAVLNYRRFLQTLDPQALERELRDKRFDRTVEAALEAGEPLSPERIDQLVRRYQAKYLAHRAEAIARTESIQALATGRQAVWEEAIAQGKIERGRLIKRWVTAKDERVRPEHQAMEGVAIPYDSWFRVPVYRKGQVVGYEDSWGPPHSVNCRCVNWIRPQVRRVV